jgi:hypothetical protein
VSEGGFHEYSILDEYMNETKNNHPEARILEKSKMIGGRCPQVKIPE